MSLIGVVLAGQLLVLYRAIILVVAESLDVQAQNYPAIAYVVKPLALHQGR